MIDQNDNPEKTIMMENDRIAGSEHDGKSELGQNETDNGYSTALITRPMVKRSNFPPSIKGFLVMLIVGMLILSSLYFIPGNDDDDDINDGLMDSDLDGIPDEWEVQFGLNPNDPADADLDQDNDGYDINRNGIMETDELFINLEEFLNNTDPGNNDTDDDDMSDGWEVVFGLDPLDPGDAQKDEDEDHLMNIGEFIHHSNPLESDVDADHLTDPGEVWFGTDPYHPDSDRDGLIDSHELFDYFGYDRIELDTELMMWMPPLERTIQVTEGHFRLKIPVTGAVHHPEVLVINDDRDRTGEFSSDLIAGKMLEAGLDVERVESTKLKNIDLADYDLIVWSSGDESNPLYLPSLRRSLIDYVADGGRLLIEGGEFSSFAMADKEFRDDVLHIQYTEMTGGRKLRQTVEHPLSSGFMPDENMTLTRYQGSDADAFRNLSDAVAVFSYFEEGPFSFGINAYDDDSVVSNGGQISYFSFDLTEVQKNEQLNTILENTISWLNPYDSTADYNLTDIMEDLDIEVLKDGTPIEAVYHNDNLAESVRYLSSGLSDINSMWLESYDLENGSYTVRISLNETGILSKIPAGFDFSIFIDSILVERFKLDPLDNDADSDGLIDSRELENGTFPLNWDSDHDGLSDFEELTILGTNPMTRDSDGDMLDDGLELGLLGDDEPSTTTDPNNPDSDGDSLYDGWFDRNRDGLYNADEKGEDINANGKRNDLETDPREWSTDGDGLPDGWELENMLDPLSSENDDGDLGNPDGDLTRDGGGFTNIMEYNTGTFPKPWDHDGDGTITGGYEDGTDWDEDGLMDGEEVFVIFRTSIMEGALVFDHYPSATISDWIYHDENITDGLPGTTYSFDSMYSDIGIRSELYDELHTDGPDINHIARLMDGSRIFLQTDLQEILIWEPYSDHNDRDANGILEGRCLVFSGTGFQAPDSSLPVKGYHHREIYWDIDPFIGDCDFDGIPDGEEVKYDEDSDYDGLLNALDTDSDGDGIPDLTEQTIYADTDVDHDGLENMVDMDSDGDLVPDSREQQSFFDPDNDAIICYLDDDSDNDGLKDGEEDSDHDGVTDRNESSPLLKDTDNDGLNDTEEVNIGWDGYITDPADQDTDDDGLNDGIEVMGWPVIINGIEDLVSSDPTKKYSDNDLLDDLLEFMHTNPMMDDSDSDSLPDDLEDKNLNGICDDGETDPREQDTDNDLLNDGTEDRNRNGIVDPDETDPLDRDSDNDFILDGLEDTDRDGILDPGETDPLDEDSDGDGLDDGTEDMNHNGIKNALETDPRIEDTDGDGIIDGTENAWNGDSDGDGLINAIDWDSDGDNIWDGWYDTDGDDKYDPGEGEDFNRNGLLDVDISGDPHYQPGIQETNPLSGDSDLDGLKDGEENSEKTNPNDPDSDDDGLLDGEEVHMYFTDPLNQHSDVDELNDTQEVRIYGTDPLVADTDGDFLLDHEEVTGFQGSWYFTDPLLKDTDGDEVEDWHEKTSGLDPNDPDSDDDEIPDGFELLNSVNTNLDASDGTDALDDFDLDSLSNLREYEQGLLLGSHDVDEDGIWNILDDDDDDDLLPTSWEVSFGLDPYEKDNRLEDPDGDNILNQYELQYGTDPLLKDSDGDYLSDFHELFVSITDPLNNDTDGDGLLDGIEDMGWEIMVIFDIDDTSERVVHGDPLLNYSDGDTLSDKEEYYLGTDPMDSDTDDDGLADDDDPSPLVREFNSPDIRDFTISVDVSVTLEAIYETVTKQVKKTALNILTGKWEDVWEEVTESVFIGWKEILDWVMVGANFFINDDETTIRFVNIDINDDMKNFNPQSNEGWFTHEVDIGSVVYNGFDVKVAARDTNGNYAEHKVNIPGFIDILDTTYYYATHPMELLDDAGAWFYGKVKDGALWLLEEVLKPGVNAILGYIQDFAGMQSQFLAPYFNVAGALEFWSDVLLEAVNILDIPDPVSIIEHGFKLAGEFIRAGMIGTQEVMELLFRLVKPVMQHPLIPEGIRDMSSDTMEFLLDISADVAALVGDPEVSLIGEIMNRFLEKMEILTGLPMGDIIPALTEFLTWPNIFDPTLYETFISGVPVPSNQSVSGFFVKLEISITLPTGEFPGEEVPLLPLGLSFYITDKGVDVYFSVATPTSIGPALEGAIDFGYAYGGRDRRGFALGYSPLSFGITDGEDTPVDLVFPEITYPSLSYSWALYSHDW